MADALATPGPRGAPCGAPGLPPPPVHRRGARRLEVAPAAVPHRPEERPPPGAGDRRGHGGTDACFSARTALAGMHGAGAGGRGVRAAAGDRPPHQGRPRPGDQAAPVPAVGPPAAARRGQAHRGPGPLRARRDRARRPREAAVAEVLPPTGREDLVPLGFVFAATIEAKADNTVKVLGEAGRRYWVPRRYETCYREAITAKDYSRAVPVVVTTLGQLTEHGADAAVWRRLGRADEQTLTDALDNPDGDGLHRRQYDRAAAEDERRRAAEREAQRPVCKRCGRKFTDQRWEETTGRKAWKAGGLSVCGTCHADDVARKGAAAGAARLQASRPTTGIEGGVRPGAGQSSVGCSAAATDLTRRRRLSPPGTGEGRRRRAAVRVGPWRLASPARRAGERRPFSTARSCSRSTSGCSGRAPRRRTPWCRARRRRLRLGWCRPRGHPARGVLPSRGEEVLDELAGGVSRLGEPVALGKPGVVRAVPVTWTAMRGGGALPLARVRRPARWRVLRGASR